MCSHRWRVWYREKIPWKWDVHQQTKEVRREAWSRSLPPHPKIISLPSHPRGRFLPPYTQELPFPYSERANSTFTWTQDLWCPDFQELVLCGCHPACGPLLEQQWIGGRRPGWDFFSSWWLLPSPGWWGLQVCSLFSSQLTSFLMAFKCFCEWTWPLSATSRDTVPRARFPHSYTKGLQPWIKEFNP